MAAQQRSLSLTLPPSLSDKVGTHRVDCHAFRHLPSLADVCANSCQCFAGRLSTVGVGLGGTATTSAREI
jgi:hypothetical protein